jgi:hypothetical protein
MKNLHKFQTIQKETAYEETYRKVSLSEFDRIVFKGLILLLMSMGEALRFVEHTAFSTRITN